MQEYILVVDMKRITDEEFSALLELLKQIKNPPSEDGGSEVIEASSES